MLFKNSSGPIRFLSHCKKPPNQKIKQRTSFLVTGFSKSTKCVSTGKVPSTSKSANSAKLFAVRTNVVRYGSDCARVGWILEIRLRARRRVFRRGERGRFPRSVISLSVKSMQSCGYPQNIQSAQIQSNPISY